MFCSVTHKRSYLFFCFQTFQHQTPFSTAVLNTSLNVTWMFTLRTNVPKRVNEFCDGLQPPRIPSLDRGSGLKGHRESCTHCHRCPASCPWEALCLTTGAVYTQNTCKQSCKLSLRHQHLCSVLVNFAKKKTGIHQRTAPACQKDTDHLFIFAFDWYIMTAGGKASHFIKMFVYSTRCVHATTALSTASKFITIQVWIKLQKHPTKPAPPHTHI